MQLTQTWLPPGIRGRHRKVARNMGELSRWFVERQRLEGRCTSMYFEDGVVYSYGSHFPLARHVFRKDEEKYSGYPFLVKSFVLVTSRPRSNATGRYYNELCHRLLNSALRDRVYYVPWVTEDTTEFHERNRLHLEREALERAEYALRQFIANRHLGATVALELFRRACEYARVTGLGGLPDADMPPGVLADWLREHRPSYTALTKCAQSLCPLTGTSMTPQEILNRPDVYADAGGVRTQALTPQEVR